MNGSRMIQQTGFRQTLRRFFALAACLLLAMSAVVICAPDQPAAIRVVMDDNYPPYIFRGGDGNLKGIIIDQWNLWEKTTGVKVEIMAMDWSDAIQSMSRGEADVIDTIFFSTERAELYEFLKPYARIEVPLFFHSDLSGIKEAKDAVGFAVGAKAGDNVINILHAAGVNTIVEYPSYEQLIKAAAEGKIKVFSVDRPPALYYLHRSGIAEKFRESPALYRGEFHRAVKKGQQNLAAIIQKGFDAISDDEYEKINSNWLGKPLINTRFWWYLGYIVAFAAAVILLLALWLRMLRQMVRVRTAELSSANEALTREIAERQSAEKDKERLQAQLQQAMKMEAVGRLAGGVAHDFNNLLTAIIGNASLTLMDLPAESSTAASLREIEKAARSAASLTQQLLAFSSRQNVEPKILNINDVVINLNGMLGKMAGDGVNLQFYTPRDLWNVLLDPGQFERILINLVLNARDAMPEGGRINITTANVILTPAECANRHDAKPGEYVRLTFSDTGHGMSEEVLEHLFEPFFTTKARGRGTGLGLSAIFGVVKQARGFIEVASEVGRGTTFDIFLPRTVKEVTIIPEKPIEQICGGEETILLVEDEDIVRFIGGEILRKLGYRILQASGGTEAIAIAQKYTGHIDLMLTDLMMPGMNGRELAEKILAMRPATRILFTSACADDTIEGKEIADRGRNFIAKPYSIESLARKVREVLMQGF